MSKRYPVARDLVGRPTSWLRALDFVDLDVYRGETLAVVGESGCGKTTLARLILRLVPASAGSVRFEFIDVLAASRPEIRRFRESVQLVPQDPYGSLDPRMRVDDIVTEGMRGEERSRAGRFTRVRAVLDLVDLPASACERYPHEFSAGQRQRIAIARALAVKPSLVILDEPVSSLDPSVQSRILNLLGELQAHLGLTYLFIAHDLSVVRHVADRIAVMYLGKIVETAPAGDLFDDALHPYTQALLSSEPTLSRPGSQVRIVLEGEPTSAIDPPPACRFVGRCFRSIERCSTRVPFLDGIPANPGHRVACFNYAPFAQATREAFRAPVVPLLEPVQGVRRGRGTVTARFVGLRFAYAIALLAVSSVVVFAALAQAPGGPGGGTGEPLATQYFSFLGGLLSGDPGNSLVSGARITSIVSDAGLKTLELGGAAAILVYALAIPLGVVAAWRRESVADRGVRVVTVLAMGLPNFFLAILLIQLFAVKLRWLPVAGPGGLEHLVLPAVVLSLESVAINLRLTRSSMLDELAKEYVQALRAKGLSMTRVVWVHALRNALVPLLAFVGIMLPLILGYTLIVEVIFRFEGLGFHLVQAIANRDYFLAQTLALLFTAAVILSNFLADVGHRIVDPRVRVPAAVTP